MIKGATIVDGSGSAPYVGNVGVKDGKIASISSNGDAPEAEGADFEAGGVGQAGRADCGQGQGYSVSRAHASHRRRVRGVDAAADGPVVRRAWRAREEKARRLSVGGGILNGMTTLKSKLQDDLTVAIKARDELRSSTLRMVLTSITNAEVAGKEARELSDEDILGVLSSEAKRRATL